MTANTQRTKDEVANSDTVELEEKELDNVRGAGNDGIAIIGLNHEIKAPRDASTSASPTFLGGVRVAAGDIDSGR